VIDDNITALAHAASPRFPVDPSACPISFSFEVRAMASRLRSGSAVNSEIRVFM
jgi:hypothetical protein